MEIEKVERFYTNCKVLKDNGKSATLKCRVAKGEQIKSELREESKSKKPED